MKSQKTSSRARARFWAPAFFAALLATALLISCQHTGAIARFGATVGQWSGLIDADTAEAIARSGAAFGRAFEEITPEQEYYIGRAVAANILSSYRLQQNQPAFVEYLNLIAKTLVINSSRPEIFHGYRVNILDSEEINAFATPGGHIFLTRALVASAPSEDALAAVIAHEIAHIQLEHGLRSIRNSRFTNALLVTGGAAVDVFGGPDNQLSELVDVFGESVNEVVTTLVVNGFSRVQEFEADEVAMGLLALAGYEPSALLDVLRALEANQPGRYGGFNSTHPSPRDRIANAQRIAHDFNVTDTRAYRVERFARAMPF
ncbi:MAG: M48 family metallopeptidase [Treponema sp.]|nr:M48 family metallopeptidase [Treponema sp.]